MKPFLKHCLFFLVLFPMGSLGLAEQPPFSLLDVMQQELSRSIMRNLPLRYPFLTLSVVVSIYWQAFRLWLKGIPFYGHPGKQPE